MMINTIEKKISALDALKALANKKPATPDAGVSVPSLSDPAIVGAKRDKNVVKLGFDPKIAERAAYAARLRAALDQAQSDFEISQAEMRDYGKDKRSVYNDAYKCVVTTVCVPYTVEVPTEEESATPGRETRYVQVVCTNKYSVNQEMVLGNKQELGPLYENLFTETITKTLKPNAEDLIRNLLQEVAGLEGESLETAMTSLFEQTTKIATKEDYEQKIKATPAPVQTLLSQMVTRVNPALKFGR